MSIFPEIKHIFVGKKQEQLYNNKPVLTAIFKDEVQEPIYATKLGFQQDEQADTKHHGGEDKAICVYLNESYTYWGKYNQHSINVGSFGENLVFSFLKEDEVCIGDIYKIGSAVVQVSQPRQPCFKLGIRNNWPEMVVISRNSGYTGFYLRVLEEGEITPQDKIELMSKEEKRYSIKYVNELLYGQHVTSTQIEEALQLTSLADSCKKDLTKKLNKLQTL